MNVRLTLTAAALALAVPFGLVAPSVAAAEALTLSHRTELPGYTGDFDHFEYDLKGNTLWLAAEDHGTLDVFDLKTLKKQKSVKGIVDTPHGILYVPEKNRLLITDSGGKDQLTRLVDSKTYKGVGTVKLSAPGPDAMGYDRSTKTLYIVNGGRDAKMKETFLTAVDPVTLEKKGEIRFDTEKVEAMAIEQGGNRLWINVTGKNEMAVLDKKDLKVLATWPIKEAQTNAPLAFDEPTRRLFIITRKPGMLIVKNADTGATITTFKAPERCDQVIWDAANKRVYALGGEGYIGVFQQKDADHYEELPHVVSATGAKTGILVPELGRLIVAASPGEAKTGAAILQFDIVPASR